MRLSARTTSIRRSALLTKFEAPDPRVEVDVTVFAQQVLSPKLRLSRPLNASIQAAASLHKCVYFCEIFCGVAKKFQRGDFFSPPPFGGGLFEASVFIVKLFFFASVREM